MVFFQFILSLCLQSSNLLVNIRLRVTVNAIKTSLDSNLLSGEGSAQRQHPAGQPRPPDPHRLRFHLVLLAEKSRLREFAVQADAGIRRGSCSSPAHSPSNLVSLNAHLSSFKASCCLRLSCGVEFLSYRRWNSRIGPPLKLVWAWLKVNE